MGLGLHLGCVSSDKELPSPVAQANEISDAGFSQNDSGVWQLTAAHRLQWSLVNQIVVRKIGYLLTEVLSSTLPSRMLVTPKLFWIAGCSVA